MYMYKGLFEWVGHGTDILSSVKVQEYISLYYLQHLQP